jgi:Ca-activated chloride channel family protein
MRLFRAAPVQLGVTSLVLVAGMTLPGCSAEGQEGKACRDSAVLENVGARSVGPSAGLTGGAHASLFTSSDSWTVHERVDEVTIFFTASDRHKFVEGLNKEDIGVTDDGKAITRISAFGSQGDLPLRLGLVVDTSSSVKTHFRVEQQASLQFLRQVMRPGRDQAFVLGFSHDIEVTQDYSDDPERLAAGVATLVNGGGTAFFDAIQNACDKLNTVREGEPAARVLIVLSDGDDNASKTTLVQAIEKAQVRDVTIYTLNTSISGRIESWQRLPPPPGDLALKRLAEETGGRSFSELNKRDLKKAFSAIEQEMRNRYALSYQPGGLQEDGRFRPIKITARKSGRRLRVHSRKGYYARLASSVE